MQRDQQPNEDTCDASLTDLSLYLGPERDDDDYEDYLAQHRLYDL